MDLNFLKKKLRDILDNTDIDDRVGKTVSSIRSNFNQPKIISPLPDQQTQSGQTSNKTAFKIKESPLVKSFTQPRKAKNIGYGREFFNPEADVDPSKPGVQNFWNNNTLRIPEFMGKAQEFVQSPPKLNLERYTTNKSQPVQFAAKMVDGIVNQPLSSIQSGGKIGEMYREKTLTPKKVVGEVANAAMLPLDVATFGVTSVLRQAGKQGIRELLKQSAKEGVKFGSVFGGLQGAYSGQDIDDPKEYVKNLGVNTAVGGAVGAGAGVAIPVVGKGAETLVKEGSRLVNNTLRTQTLEQFAQNMPKYLDAPNPDPVIQKYKKALQVDRRTAREIGEAVTDTLTGYLDKGYDVLERSTAKYLPQFKDLDTRVKAQIWDYILARKQNLGDVTPHPLIKELDDAIFKVAGFDVRQGGFAKFDEFVPKKNVSQERLTDIRRQYKTADEYAQAKWKEINEFRDGHRAPGMDTTPVNERLEGGGDFSLEEVAKGIHNQPSDYFDPRVGARYYSYDNQSGMESYTAISNILRGQQAGKTNMTVTAYRAVPKSVKASDLQDGDWITFSKNYAKEHGESRFGSGEYKIIEKEVKPNEVWWDGNDINEWGYDTGKTYNKFLDEYNNSNVAQQQVSDGAGVKKTSDFFSENVEASKNLKHLLTYDKELLSLGYTPKQIDKISAKEAQKIIKEGTPPFMNDKFDADFQSPSQPLKTDSSSQKYAELEAEIGGGGNAFNRTNNLPERTANAYKNWVNTIRTGREVGGVRAKRDFKQFDSEGVNIFTKIQKGASGFEDLRKYFNQRYKAIKDAGIPLNYQQDYLPQLWNNTKDEIEKVFVNKLSTGRPGFTLDKVIEDYQTGINAGLKPRFEKLSDIVGWYEASTTKAIADKKFFDTLVSDGMIAPANSAPNGWVTLNPDAFPTYRTTLDSGETYLGNYKAPKAIADLVNNYLNKPSPILETPAKIVSNIKGIILSSGIPKTAITFHSFNTVARSFLSSKNPVGAVIKGGWWMLNPKSAEKYVNKNLDRFEFFSKHGLTGSTEDQAFSKVAQEIRGNIAKKGLIRLKGWQEKTFEDNVFKKLIPAMKLDLAESVYKDLKTQLSDADAARQASSVANEFFGGINVDELGRDKNLQNLLRATFLASDWGETNIRIGTGAVKNMMPGIRQKLSPAQRMVYTRMMRNLIVAYVGANVLNKALSGNWMWENDPGSEFAIDSGQYSPNGKKIYIRPFGTGADFVRLPYEIASSALKGDFSTTARAVRNRLSPGLSFGLGLATDTDWRGRPIGWRGKDKWGNDMDALSRVGGITNEFAGLVSPSYVRSGIDMATGRIDPVEGMAQATELPLRFTGGAHSNVQKQMQELAKAEGMSGKDLHQLNESLRGQRQLSEAQLEYVGDGKGFQDRLGVVLDNREKNRIEEEEKEAVRQGQKVLSSSTIRWMGDDGSVVSVDLTTKPNEKQGIDAFKKDNSNAQKARKIWGAPHDQITNAEKEAAFKQLGYTWDEVRYDYISQDGFTNDARTNYILSKDMTKDELIERLLTGRVESISGNMFVRDGVIDNLRDLGHLTAAEAKYLKSIKLDKDGNQKPAKSGKGKKLKLGTTPKISSAKTQAPETLQSVNFAGMDSTPVIKMPARNRESSGNTRIKLKRLSPVRIKVKPTYFQGLS